MSTWNDNFTDANGTALSAHTPDSGGSWAAMAGVGAIVQISNNRIYDEAINPSSIGWYLHSATMPQADQQVSMVVHCFSSAGQFGAILRGTTSPEVCHWVNYDGTGGTWQTVYLGQGNIAGSQVSDPGRFVAGNDYTVVFKEVGNTVSVTVNGTQVYSFTISGTQRLAGPGQTGVGFQTVQSTSTGFHIDSAAGGASTTPATSYAITGPAAVITGITSVPSTSVRGLVGGPYTVTFSPAGGVLAADFTATFSDGAGGTFSGLTIPAGQSSGTFTYAPAGGPGSRTITATETSGNGLGVKTLTVNNAAYLVVVDGNSLSDNVAGHQGAGVSWPLAMAPVLGTNYAIVDLAVAGQTTENMISDAATEIDPLVSHSRAGNILIGWELGNSVSFTADTTAQVNAAYASYMTARQAAGYTCISGTAPHRTGTFAEVNSVQSDAAFDAAIDTINATLRSTWPSLSSAMVDVAAQPDFSNPANPTFFSDGTHPTPTGYTELASLFGAAVLFVVAGATPGGGLGGDSPGAGGLGRAGIFGGGGLY